MNEQLSQMQLYRDLIRLTLEQEFDRIDSLEGASPEDICYAQSLHIFFGHYENKKIFINRLNSNGVYMLPDEALQHINLSLLRLSLSKLRFRAYVVLLSAVRLLRFFALLLKFGNISYGSTSAVVLGINPRYAEDVTNSYTFSSWLRKNFYATSEQLPHLKFFQKTFILPKLGIGRRLLCALRAIWLFVKGFTSLCFGNYKKLLLLDEFLMALSVKCSKKATLPATFFYCYQGTILRPLWTYAAEIHGSRVILFFNSSSAEPSLDGEMRDNLFLRYTNWPEIIPFNALIGNTFSNYIIGRTKIHLLPTLYIHDSNLISQSDFQSKNLVSIFDIPPIQATHHIGYSENIDYLQASGVSQVEFLRAFYEACFLALEGLPVHIVVKPKKITKRIEPDYLEMLNVWQSQKRITLLSHSVSPYRLVNLSKLSIVEPFTSVGHFFESQSKICFFDVLKVLPTNHASAHGQKLCVGLEELQKWVAQNFSSDNHPPHSQK
jgi:hypothetical protein